MGLSAALDHVRQVEQVQAEEHPGDDAWLRNGLHCNQRDDHEVIEKSDEDSLDAVEVVAKLSGLLSNNM